MTPSTPHEVLEREMADSTDIAARACGDAAGETSCQSEGAPTSDGGGTLSDPVAVHINMLRGGIAKLTPAQIGHLYRGDEAVQVIAEVLRQNPQVQPEDALYRLVNAARRHIATHPVYRSRLIGNEGSRARLEQADQIQTEDELREAVQAALSLIGASPAEQPARPREDQNLLSKETDQ